MKKIILCIFLFCGFMTFSKERFINKCRIQNKNYSGNSLMCKSLETGKSFQFYIDDEISLDDFHIGKVYKINFYDDLGYFVLYDYRFLY